jgi:hypothetical protein
MISLSNLFKQEIITETIVDYMFDSLQAHIIDNNIEQALKDIEDFAAKLHIRILDKINNNIPERIRAQTKSFGPIAQITILRNKNVKVNSKEYFLVLIHELAHAVFIICFSFKISEEAYNHLTLPITVMEASKLDYNNMTITNSLKYLQYIFDFREWTPMAFTVAYGSYQLDNFEDIVKNNQVVIDKFLSDKSNIDIVKTLVETQGEFFSVLFNVQLAMYFLRDKSKEYMKYKTKVAKFIKLVIKYQSRLKKLMNEVKS